MKQDFLHALENSFNERIFTDNDLKILFPDKELSQIHNSLSYHLKHSRLKKFKRGLYTLNSNKISKFLISNYLYNPSYVSFESALSFYNLIPEGVYETTAACFQNKKKNFNNEDGVFSFSHIPIKPFFTEVIKSGNEKFLIAKPMRALFDLIYTHKKNYLSLDELEADLRLDLEELSGYLEEYSAFEILSIGQLYEKKNTIKFSETLVRHYK